MTDQDDREGLLKLRYEGCTCSRIHPHMVDLILEAGYRRPTPRTVTTVEAQSEAFWMDLWWRASGDDWPVPEDLPKKFAALVATVLTPAPAPVSVIHLTDLHGPSATAMCGEPTTVVTERGDTRPICQTCHREAMKSAQAHAPAPVDREAMEAAVVSVIGPNPRHRYLPDECEGCAGIRDQARAVLDAIKEVLRG